MISIWPTYSRPPEKLVCRAQPISPLTTSMLMNSIGAHSYSAKNTSGRLKKSTFDEAYSCISRTFTYVFLLDTAFVIFNNTPPRMVLQEMELEMTAPESCFQALDAADCYTHWHASISNQSRSPDLKPLLLAEAISVLMQDDHDSHSHILLDMSTLNLFSLIGGLHTILFQQKSFFTCLQTSLLPIRSALMRWQSAWAARKDAEAQEVTEPESWKDTGFIGHAQEYAWLFLARLDALDSQASTVPSTVGRNAKPVIGRLDDTSMSVVTDLMLNFTISGG
jgi:hypothetical protein